MTRLFVLSDTHGRPWSQRAHDVDAVLFAGDLVDSASAEDDLPPTVNATELAWRRRTAGLPADWDAARTVAVRGNHDTADTAQFFADADDLSTGRLRRLASGLWVGGIGWHGGRYFDLPTEDDLRPRCDALRRAVLRQTMPGDRLVLLTHYPPALAPLPTLPQSGACYRAIADLVRDLRPVLVVAGHLHDWAGTVAPLRYEGGNATLVMPGPAGLHVTVADDGAVGTV